MGIFSFLKKEPSFKDDSIHNVRLVNLVQKEYNQPEGIFANINNDLNESITNYSEKYSPLAMMAYAYARRTAAEGLLLQGIFTRSDYKYVSEMFKIMQLQTGHTVEFQEEACEHAIEFLQSYDKRLDKSATQCLHAVACSKDTILPKGRILQYNEVIYAILSTVVQFGLNKQ